MHANAINMIKIEDRQFLMAQREVEWRGLVNNFSTTAFTPKMQRKKQYLLRVINAHSRRFPDAKNIREKLGSNACHTKSRHSVSNKDVLIFPLSFGSCVVP